MRIDRINELADFIEQLPPEKFSMDTWAFFRGTDEVASPRELLYDCRTCACIGGWAEALFNENKDVKLNLYLGGYAPGEPGFVERARYLLELDEQTSVRLFTPRFEWRTITQQEAVATLRNLAVTGEVVWEGRDC